MFVYRVNYFIDFEMYIHYYNLHGWSLLVCILESPFNLTGYSFWHPMEDLIPNWKDFGISQLRSDPNMQYLNAEHSTYV